MTLKVRFHDGDCVPTLLAETLGVSDDAGDIWGSTLDCCRAFAFDCDNSSEFRDWYLRSEAFSKYEDGDSSMVAVKEQLAITSFLESEQACREANLRLVGWDYDARISVRIWRRARAIVHDILGNLDRNKLIGFCQFGPGATADLPRRKAQTHNKWSCQTTITEGALPYYWAFRRWSNIDLTERLIVSQGNRVTTVPKSYKARRLIAVEPTWSNFFQAGLGRYIRSRLRKRGLLRPDAQYVHRELAKEGSITGELATLDLKAASDTVSLGVCYALLPPEWFQAVCELRSPRGELPGGEVVDYAKVSSMGNGFTFELETLIFYALTAACCSKGSRVSVYGDDIVCPSAHAVDVMGILQEAGFTINAEKSFWSGGFRESCGGHYFNGDDVTPFYIRRPISRLGYAIELHNQVLGWSGRYPISDMDFGPVLDRFSALVPRKVWGPRVPGVLWKPWDQCTPRWSSRTQSYVLTTVKSVRWQRHVGNSWGAVLSKLWVENDEAETSWTEYDQSFDVLSVQRCYRDAWDDLPVRLA